MTKILRGKWPLIMRELKCRFPELSEEDLVAGNENVEVLKLVLGVKLEMSDIEVEDLIEEITSKSF
ncbi:hypothetical protein V6R21_11765 [Limibacter armeniacum]|uniref:hypothetical protein n=1 Tax=Limibacter armeniacum TaxID=466084 RepID=UPI002FE4FF9D